MNSIDLRQYKSRIIAAVNSIEAPMELKRMALRDVYCEVENAADREIYMENQIGAENEQNV